VTGQISEPLAAHARRFDTTSWLLARHRIFIPDHLGFKPQRVTCTISQAPPTVPSFVPGPVHVLGQIFGIPQADAELLAEMSRPSSSASSLVYESLMTASRCDLLLLKRTGGFFEHAWRHILEDESPS